MLYALEFDGALQFSLHQVQVPVHRLKMDKCNLNSLSVSFVVVGIEVDVAFDLPTSTDSFDRSNIQMSLRQYFDAQIDFDALERVFVFVWNWILNYFVMEFDSKLKSFGGQTCYCGR